MQILLSCAKTMTDHSDTVHIPFTTQPHYQEQADHLALQLTRLTVEEIETMLRVNRQIATENRLRYQHFHGTATSPLPTLLAYTGIVFKHIDPKTFAAEDFTYAHEHLHLTSFLYGLLRPLDVIKNYRLEGDAVLPDNEGQTMFEYWQSRLTDRFIRQIKADDGILVNLASDEMKHLFDWKRVCKEVCVITPEFKVWKGGKLRTIVIYTKMCRGEMTRYLLQKRIHTPESILAFEWEGFRLNPEQSKPDTPVFTL